MGLSGSKTTTNSSSTTKPVYAPQIEGAASTLTGAYNAAAPITQRLQDNLVGQIGTATSNYNANPSLNAAKNYVTSTLSGGYQANPFLESILKQSNADTVNATNAGLGTRGLAGGSTAAKIIAGQVAKNDQATRYNDYNNWQARQASAAALAPSLSGADATNLQALLSLSGSAANLGTDQAAKYAAAMSGLLGSYTDSQGTNVSKSNPSLGAILGAILSSASSNAAAMSGG